MVKFGVKEIGRTKLLSSILLREPQAQMKSVSVVAIRTFIRYNLAFKLYLLNGCGGCGGCRGCS